MSQPPIPIDLILSKLAEEAEKAQERVQKAPDVLLGPLDTSIASSPYEVVYEEDRVKLKHYTPVTEIQLKPRSWSFMP
jgi:polyhydroxyalkanoate synthase